MRVTQAETTRIFLSNLETLNETYNRLSGQLSSGKKLNQLKDSPGDSANLLSMTDRASDIDQYQSSGNTVSFNLGVADSALNEINNLVTSIYSKGSEAASESINNSERAAIATDVRSLRDQVLSLANSQAKGRYIFAGSQVAAVPYTINADSITYHGDTAVATVGVDDGIAVPTGVSGSDAFSLVFSSIEALITAIGTNNTSSIGSALGQFASAFSQLGQARGTIGASMNTLQSVQDRLSTEETTLEAQRSQIEDADMAKAAVQMSQTKTALDAAMTAGGSILQQRNLFDILG
jgi:flagellar hook-associated protein 3 FlgL